jgi:hypothetical protein
MQERVESTIGNLIVQNADLGVQVETLTAKLIEADARIKELEAKPDDKRRPPIASGNR